MKIQIHTDRHSYNVLLPTRLLFSKAILKFGLRLGKRYSDAVPDIPPSAIDALCDDIRRIQKIHPSWELVDIRSADGERVRIFL